MDLSIRVLDSESLRVIAVSDHGKHITEWFDGHNLVRGRVTFHDACF